MTSETITPHYRRKAYKRGQKIERNYYQELMKDL